MKNIHLAQKITALRKDRKITQEALAKFLGVSKAAVSKWETGQSFPDITLLPQLADYFGVTIDTLMGYEPQLTREEIRETYHRLARAFTTEPAEAVYRQCQTLIHDYYACMPLLFQMGLLLINHLDRFPAERHPALLQEILDLMERCKTGSPELRIFKQANAIEALCQYNLGNYDTTIFLLEDCTSTTDCGDDHALLAMAHQAKGDAGAAQETIQVGTYNALLAFSSLLMTDLNLNPDQPKRFDAIITRFLTLRDAFQLEALHPNTMFQFYLTAAAGYLAQGKKEAALDMLGHYVSMVTPDLFPFTLHGDDFFNQIDPWLSDFDLGPVAPRSDGSIAQSLVASLRDYPAFAVLQTNGRFKNLVAELTQRIEAITHGK